MTIEEVELGVHIRFVHRPLSRYVNALAEHGLLLERMVEPAPPPGFLALAAGVRRRGDRAPAAVPPDVQGRVTRPRIGDGAR